MSYRIPEKTIETIMVLYKNKKTMAQPPDGDTNFFYVLAGVPQSDIREVPSFSSYPWIMSCEHL